MSIYCTYITFYRGNKLPPFYIGSTFVEKVNNGYHGSVSSREYKPIWKSELKNNLHLFETKILTTHLTRADALEKENYFQVKLNAIRSPMYINKGYAYRTFGDQTSERMKYDNPMSKMRRNRGSFKKGQPGRIWTDVEKEKGRKSKLGELNPNFGKPGCWDHLNLVKYKYAHCGIETTKGNITRWHNDNCKLKPQYEARKGFVFFTENALI